MAYNINWRSAIEVQIDTMKFRGYVVYEPVIWPNNLAFLSCEVLPMLPVCSSHVLEPNFVCHNTSCTRFSREKRKLQLKTVR